MLETLRNRFSNYTKESEWQTQQSTARKGTHTHRTMEQNRGAVNKPTALTI